MTSASGSAQSRRVTWVARRTPAERHPKNVGSTPGSAPEQLAGHTHDAADAAQRLERAAGRGLVDHFRHRALEPFQRGVLVEAELVGETHDVAAAEDRHQLLGADAGVAAVA